MFARRVQLSGRELREGIGRDRQDMQCGKICHARWLTTAERLLFLWTRVHSLTGNDLKVLELLVTFCVRYYFKIYYDVKVKHSIADAPYHILTSLRILKTLPKKVQQAVSFYIRTSAWYAHAECCLLSLLYSPNPDDRLFAVNIIFKVRKGAEFGDNSVRPRITPKLNMSATSLTTLISWKENEVQEPSFTCSLSSSEIKSFISKPYDPPKFSCHTQSTERVVQLVTDAAGQVCGQDARDGYILAKLEHREELPVYKTKSHMLATFPKHP